MRAAMFCLPVAWAAIASPLICSAQESRQAPPKESAAGEKPEASSSGYWEKLVMHPFRDAKGQVIVEMPFPADWKVAEQQRQGEPTISGPHGIKVFDFPLQFFVFSPDPFMQQAYAQSGQRMRPLPPVEQLIQQDLVPWSARLGLEFVRHYELPEVARVDKWYNDQLFKVGPSEVTIRAIGTEWKHKETGDPSFLLVRLSASVAANMQSWSYFTSGLQADRAHFETARKQFIFGLANARHRPEAIMAYNQEEARRVGQSWEAHNRRMAQNQALFEASQRAFVNRSRAINDSIMQGWKERNAASDRAHERFVDTITERTKVVDAETGATWKVEGFSNQYWMNRDGEYFGTDNPNYDPNRDVNMNQENWRKLDPVK